MILQGIPIAGNRINELGGKLEKQGLRYVRYADDFSIYAKSNHAARKAGNQAYLFLKNKLKLPINREKSGIRKPVNFSILRFGFVLTYVKWIRNKYRRFRKQRWYAAYKFLQHISKDYPSLFVHWQYEGFRP